MSEQQQGPGWWLASDGRWYPPEQHPGVVPPGGWAAPAPEPGAPPPWSAPPPAPVPPQGGMSTGGKVALTLGGLLGVLVLLVLVVTLLGTSTDDPEAVPITGVAPDSFVRFDDPDAAFSLEVHPDWLALSLRGDVSGLGAANAPDDAARAAAIDAAVATLPRQIVFVALDSTTLAQPQFVSNMNLVPIPRDGASIEEIEAEIPQSVEVFGATGAEVERVSTAAGEGLRMTYRFAGGGPMSGVEGLQYYVLTDDTVWVLTMTSDHMARDRESFDATAASLEVR